jgi:hypothetical protein
MAHPTAALDGKKAPISSGCRSQWQKKRALSAPLVSSFDSIAASIA